MTLEVTFSYKDLENLFAKRNVYWTPRMVPVRCLDRALEYTENSLD